MLGVGSFGSPIHVYFTVKHFLETGPGCDYRHPAISRFHCLPLPPKSPDHFSVSPSRLAALVHAHLLQALHDLRKSVA